MKSKHSLPLIALTLVMVLALGIALGEASGGTISQSEIDKIVGTTTDQSKIESPAGGGQNRLGKRGGRQQLPAQQFSPFDSFGFGFGFGYREQTPQQHPRLRGTGSGIVVSPTAMC